MLIIVIGSLVAAFVIQSTSTGESRGIRNWWLV
jgi:hypothetical protein